MAVDGLEWPSRWIAGGLWSLEPLRALGSLSVLARPLSCGLHLSDRMGLGCSLMNREMTSSRGGDHPMTVARWKRALKALAAALQGFFGPCFLFHCPDLFRVPEPSPAELEARDRELREFKAQLEARWRRPEEAVQETEGTGEPPNSSPGPSDDRGKP